MPPPAGGTYANPVSGIETECASSSASIRITQTNNYQGCHAHASQCLNAQHTRSMIMRRSGDNSYHISALGENWEDSPTSSVFVVLLTTDVNVLCTGSSGPNAAGHGPKPDGAYGPSPDGIAASHVGERRTAPARAARTPALPVRHRAMPSCAHDRTGGRQPPAGVRLRLLTAVGLPTAQCSLGRCSPGTQLAGPGSPRQLFSDYGHILIHIWVIFARAPSTRQPSGLSFDPRKRP